MNLRRFAFIPLALILTSCGGGGGSGLEDYEVSAARSDAATAAYNISKTCGAQQGFDDPGVANDLPSNSASVDTLIAIAKKTANDSDVLDTLRSAAEDLRSTCKDSGLASRLNAVTDAN